MSFTTDMDLLTFSGEVLESETSSVRFLQAHGVIPNSVTCPGKQVANCAAEIIMVHRKNRSGRFSMHWRCTKKMCRVERSVRTTSLFLKYEKRDGSSCSNMSLCDIMRLLYLWLHTTSTVRQLHLLTGHSLQTLTDWTNLFREVCSHSTVRLPQLLGTAEEPVQIDESYFRGRRKI